MARLSGNLDFTGSIGNISAYKNKATGETILRTKGGASKEKIRHDKAFESTRRNNNEFGGASSAGKALRDALYPVHHITGGSAGYINKLMLALAKMDSATEWGRRAVRFSETRRFLEGFDLNKRSLLNSIIRQPALAGIDRSAGSGSLVIPALIPGINLQLQADHKLYRFALMLAVITDFEYKPLAEPFYRPVMPVTYATEISTTAWFSSKEHLKNFTGLPDCHTILIALGIEFGQPLSNQLTEIIPKSGTVQILATG